MDGIHHTNALIDTATIRLLTQAIDACQAASDETTDGVCDDHIQAAIAQLVQAITAILDIPTPTQEPTP